MMNPTTVYQWIAEDGIVAGSRGNFPPSVALPLVETLLDEGIRSFEWTMNSVEPIETMMAVKKEFGDAVSSGMGTVLNLEMAKRVVDAGADFVVSPAFQPEVVKYIHERGVFVAPGVITPSEAVAAWELGVPMLKIFPIGALGIEYFKAVFGPLSHMKFMCNGAVNDQNLREFLQSGAVAGGLAGWLTGDGTWTESKLRSRARLLKNAVAVARGQQPVLEA